MTLETLRAAQMRLRNHYEAQPEAAQFTLRAVGRVEAGLACRVQSNGAATLATMHPGVGGSGRGACPCPGDMLLESLAACAGVTLSAVAAGMGIELRSASVRAEGDLDFRAPLGMASDIPMGFQRIRMTFVLDTDAAEDKLARLLQRTESFCVVYQTLARTASMSTDWVRGTREGDGH